MQPADDSAGQHRQAWDLIPWVMNGSASADDRMLVARHLVGCADCREEFAFQSRLYAAIKDAPGEAPVAQETAQAERIWDRLERQAGAARPRAVAGGRRVHRLLLAAVAAEAVALVALGAARIAGPTAAATYHTLSAPAVPHARATLRAVLAPELSLGEMQRLLGALDLEIVAGPSEAGVYTLAPAHGAGTTPARTLATLAQLRAHPAVRFAEPITEAVPAPPAGGG